jgi:hypothetical protein
MTKLTDAQRAMLFMAATRDDGAVSAPEKAGKAGAAKVAGSLIARKLMREVKAKAGAPVWRKDVTGKPVSLIITREGRKAVDRGVVKGGDGRPPEMRGDGDVERVKRAEDLEASSAPRAGTKQALLVRMLSKEQGVTLDILIGATGWLPHTTRAALTGLRKKGYVIERIRGEGEKSSAYRIVTADKAAA